MNAFSDRQPQDEDESRHQPASTGRGPSRRGKWIRRGVIALVALLALFYGAGGWYFSTQLGNDAFVVDEPGDGSDEDFDIEIVAISGDEVTFRAEEGSDDDLIAAGSFGVDVAGGWLLVGDVIEADIENGFDLVTRSLEASTGQAPGAGTPADFDSWFYEADPADLGLPHEDVKFRSPLGEFDAWYVPADDETWVIVIHGKGAEQREGLRIVESINAAGHPALVITYRNDPGLPEDPSGYYRYGSTEWAEVEGAVQYALAQGAQDVVLVGLSTGAANALSFFYESDLGDRVVGAIFDSPNVDFGRTVDYEASQRTVPLLGFNVPQSLTNVAKLIGSIRYDFDWSKHDFINDAEKIGFPILIFHGTEDDTVPLDVSERLEEERPDLVTLRVTEGAAHVQSWNSDPAGYGAAVESFLADVG